MDTRIYSKGGEGKGEETKKMKTFKTQSHAKVTVCRGKKNEKHDG